MATGPSQARVTPGKVRQRGGMRRNLGWGVVAWNQPDLGCWRAGRDPGGDTGLGTPQTPTAQQEFIPHLWRGNT